MATVLLLVLWGWITVEAPALAPVLADLAVRVEWAWDLDAVPEEAE